MQKSFNIDSVFNLEPVRQSMNRGETESEPAVDGLKETRYQVETVAIIQP